MMKYRHFKGNIYRFICLARDSDDLTLKVIYENVETHEIWVRDYLEFNSLVDKEKYPDVKQKYRFELISDD